MIKKVLQKGDYVVAKKWNGEEMLGILEYTYTDGEHCVKDAKTNKRFCSHKNDIRLATEEEENKIKLLLKENNIIMKKYITPTVIEEDELEEALAAR